MSAKKPRIAVECLRCGKRREVLECVLANGRGKYCSRTCSTLVNSRHHGHSRNGNQSPTYNTWASMRQRCTNPKATKWPAYGGAGITVCDRWSSFEAFLADMGERPEGRTLDRIDGSLGYSPENCRWASHREQQTNIRSNRLVHYGAETMPLTVLAQRLGIRPSTLVYRIARGWPEANWGKSPWAGNRSASTG